MRAFQNGKTVPPPRTVPTLWDGITAALLCGAALFLLLFPLFTGEPGLVCVVRWDGGETTLPLAEDAVLVLESSGHCLTVTVSDGAVSVTASDCPDGVCLASGAIQREGQVVVCVPSGVVVRIPGDTGEDFILG